MKTMWKMMGVSVLAVTLAGVAAVAGQGAQRGECRRDGSCGGAQATCPNQESGGGQGQGQCDRKRERKRDGSCTRPAAAQPGADQGSGTH